MYPPDYTKYQAIVRHQLTLSILTFKQDINYTEILEHTDYIGGLNYLNHIKNKNKISEIAAVIDKIGDPLKSTYQIPETIECSPSVMRYIFHAENILENLPDFSHIVELGGGYGGLCVALHLLAPEKILSYTIIDLKEVIQLQERYLKETLGDNHVQFVDASTFGKDIPHYDIYLISNYCFSEISKELRYNYESILFPKVTHGFMAWNFIPVYPFKPNIIEKIIPDLDHFVLF